MSSPPVLPVAQAFALALQHHHAGRRADAEALYRQILATAPNHAEAWHSLGLLADQAGRHDLAEKWIRHAIVLHPNNPAAHFHLGEACRALGRFDEAMAAYRRGLELRSDFPEAHYNLGVVLAGKGQFDEALAAFQRAVQLRPDYAEAHLNLGAALAKQKQFDGAVAAYRRALELKPGYLKAQYNLGLALAAKRQPSEAAALFRHVLQLQPDYPEAHTNLGAALADLGQLNHAIAAHRRALRLRPDYPEAHINLGSALAGKGQSEKAIAAFRQAIALQPELPEAHFCLALVLLAQGKFIPGWEEYEWRCRAFADRRRNFSQPPWDGKPALGKTLLVHTEQGFGDTLQFLRYLPLIRAQSGAARIVLECQRALVPLLTQSGNAEIEIVARSGSDAALPPFDLHHPLLSSPLVLQRFQPMPVSAPYLQADAMLRARWRERLGARTRLRVGLAWAGNPMHRNDHYRSIAAEKLAPLLRVSGAEFVSLQVQPRPPLPPILAAAVQDFAADLGDFSASAALMAELDLIITVDTAVAHLAGALGRPVWTLLSSVSDWRWGLDGEHTPWYPTMRLFRQSRAGQWEPVVTRVAATLRHRCAQQVE